MQIQLELKNQLDAAIKSLQAEEVLPGATERPIKIEYCRDPEHGDFASNIAMLLAKPAKMAPIALADKIVAALPGCSIVQDVKVAAPGFINFRIKQAAISEIVGEILKTKDDFGSSAIGAGQKVHIEFVSANPTGPLHVGHGRGAAFGACLVNLLRITGHKVHSEYYVNDAGRQIRILGFSAWVRYLQLFNDAIALPDGAYRGEYVTTIAEKLKSEFSNKWQVSEDVCAKLMGDLADISDVEKRLDAAVELAISILGAEKFAELKQLVMDSILSDIKDDLSEFGVIYNAWFKETSLFSDGLLEQGIARLRAGGYVYEKDGALWFKATELGDEKDRVLIRENGQPTYFASDVAYHLYKYEQGYDQIIDVFGADHHGYIARIRAFLIGLQQDPDKLRILLVQFAILYRGKEKIAMSTRGGEFVTLRQLRAEVGNDAARYFYVMRKPEQHLDFDLELAQAQSQDNPVYYIQYAHARVCSVFRQLPQPDSWDESAGLEALERLDSAHERALMLCLQRYPSVIEQAAVRHEPHLLANYLHELAAIFQSYYNAERFIVDDVQLSNARLALIRALQVTICNGLRILGLSAPDSM